MGEDGWKGAGCDSLAEFADRIAERYTVVSFVGGGGKTTILLRLASMLRLMGKRVIVTTTTHMARPDGHTYGIYEKELYWLSEEAEDTLLQILQSDRLVIAGRPDPKSEKKIIGVSESFWWTMRQYADVILVEADGSRRRPVKIPMEWEPVIPEPTGCTVAVLGISALDQPIAACAYEPEHLARYLGKCVDDRLTEQDAVKILTSVDGLRKSVLGDYMVVLNQADSPEQRRRCRQILESCLERGIYGFQTHRREKLALILLAAGKSSRFDGDKMMAVLPGGKTMLQIAVELAERVDCTERILVYRQDSVKRWMEERQKQNGSDIVCRWKLVQNEQPELGISRSLQLGIQHCGEVDGYLFCVCDQPKLSEELISRIVRVWKNGEGEIVSASAEGRPGNPKLFCTWLKGELMQLNGDSGGREILRNHSDKVIFVEAKDPGELYDVDTVENLKNLLANSCRV